jgi:L-2-hydroxyglutarate oxidase LhgO
VTTNDQFDAVVIGAGIVGLAVARALALRGNCVAVLERRELPAQETSSRNSGVIHSGIYYPTGSLKARLCVRGRALLYDFCRERDIAHRRCGKLIVAQEDQLPKLRALLETGRRNGVDDLIWLDAAAVRELEPQLHCAAGLSSPATGIVDVHELVSAYEADLQAKGGTVVVNTGFESATRRGAAWEIVALSDGEVSRIECGLLVNCAGLQAVATLDRIEGYPQARRRRPRFAKGNYFSCHAARPFRHLVYPLPDEAGLGIHATLDLDGRLRFGPDVEWTDELTYDVDAARGASFYASIREYWPALPDGALQPAFAGIRPKLVGAGEPAADFLIEGPETHGVTGVINLLGIESPGLTASLAIAEHVCSLL